ncbi:MAG: copper resistance D family protein [Gemmatimonadales bacterium]
MVAVLAPLQQWLLICGASLAVGCAAWRLFVAPRAALSLPDATRAELSSIASRVARLGAIAAALLLVAWALRMVAQVMAFRDPFVPLREDVSFLLFETFWGTVWMAQGVVLLLLVVAFWGARVARSPEEPRRPSIAWWVAGALVLALAATLALSSHAMGVERGRPWLVAADALHALTAGTWIGSLAVILGVGRGASEADGDPSAFAAQIRSFSPLALASGMTLVSMGVLLSWTHVQSFANLFGTRYGRILAAKIAVAGAVFVVGFLNWRRGVPACDRPEGAAEVRSRAAGEVFFAVGVLLLTAVLVNSPKPGE